jgi:hypothetical protein
MEELFKEFATDQEKKFATKAKNMSLDAVLGNGEMMKELAALSKSSIDELRKEIERNRNPEEVIRMKSEFNTMWDIRKRETEESMERVVGREGDRVIKAVTSGPHDRIVDPVWRDTLSFRITHASPFSLGYLRTLEGHGGWLLLPCHNISNKSHVGMAWKRQGTPIRHGVEGLLRREGFQFHHGWSRYLGTQVHRYQSYAEHS